MAWTYNNWRGGHNAGPPNGDTVEVPDGDTITLPARLIPANALRPVIRLPEVEQPQPRVIPGALSQGDRAKIVVEQERVRALRHHEATMEARERDTTKYDPQYDFSFLAICRLGKIKPNKPPQVEEVETRKIADPTTKEDVEASEEDTT